MVVIRREAGKRRAARYPVTVPLNLVTGHMERMTDRDLSNLLKDVTHERMRREGGFPAVWGQQPEQPATRPAWRPDSALHRGDK